MESGRNVKLYMRVNHLNTMVKLFSKRHQMFADLSFSHITVKATILMLNVSNKIFFRKKDSHFRICVQFATK